MENSFFLIFSLLKVFERSFSKHVISIICSYTCVTCALVIESWKNRVWETKVCACICRITQQTRTGNYLQNLFELKRYISNQYLWCNFWVAGLHAAFMETSLWGWSPGCWIRWIRSSPILQLSQWKLFWISGFCYWVSLSSCKDLFGTQVW